ncbi:MAG: hypothetical protein KDB27_23515 [Planctomycetales bacterium]|nr:hypothetical protein [Planctomycetales bacterium]
MSLMNNRIVCLLLSVLFITTHLPVACADEQADARQAEMEAKKKEAMERAMRERKKGEEGQRGGPNNGKPPEGNGDQNQKPGEENKQESNDTPAVVKRPAEPETPFDPRQYEAVKPDPDGKYKLAFVGTPWPPLIQWLGEISGRSVDWQELPGDFVNIRTQRHYAVPEVEGIINRHLLARGYTILIDQELLTVEKTADINASLVPRILAEDLADHQPYEFARVLFDLDWLVAEDVAKELKPLVSKNGRLTAFAGTNRIEAMDSVRNLRQISDMLGQEQSQSARSKLVREFALKNVSAKSVLAKLKEIVGAGGAAPPQLNPDQMRQQQEMMRRMRERGQDPNQMQQQQQQNQGGDKISFIVNDQRNSIIATAPPNKMVIIEQTIKLLDVSNGRGDSLDSYVGRMKAYRLVSLDPEEVVNILTETGGLDPTARLTVDKDSKSLIASAPPWDHMTIQKLIDKLDGSSREFRVLRLRRRRADQVATTIQGLMVGEEKKDDNRRYRWWDDNQNDDDDDSFRVAADIEHNWLLLWCNDQEYDQVLRLLQELGEVPEQGVMPSKYRVLQEVPTGDTADFLQRVKEAFEQMAPNSVEIDPRVERALKKEAEQRQAEEEAEKTNDTDEEEEEELDGNIPRIVPELQDVRADDPDTVTAFVQSTQRANDNNTKPAVAGAPLRITQDSNGRLVIQSDDPRALDLFEEISSQLMPQPKGFHVFQLEHQMATWAALKLEDFFEEEDDKNDNRPWWWYEEFGSDSSDDKVGLGDRPKIKFVSEVDSNTIVVRNATDSQLRTIKELLKIYDIPEPVDPKLARYTAIYKVKYSRASLISETVKSAFPDLLSSNDQVVQRGRQNQNQNRGNGRNGNRGQDDEDRGGGGGSSGGLLLGQLSIGADDTTNTLIVSTKGEQLQKVIMPIIERLDKEAAQADVVHVVPLKGNASSEIAESLAALLGSGSVSKGEGEQRPNEREQDEEERRRREEQNQNQNRGGGRPFVVQGRR